MRGSAGATRRTDEMSRVLSLLAWSWHFLATSLLKAPQTMRA
jgi:hypothetical protein